MGWVDKEHIPVLAQDWRYGRLLNLTKRLLEDRVPTCGNCQGGTITVKDADGNEITNVCGECQGRGEVGNPVGDEDSGQVGGR